jgi:uncharacterized protein
LVALIDKVDAFVDRVTTRHRDDLACRSGCAQCCQVRLTVTAVEATHIRVWAAARTAAERAAIVAAAVAATDPVRCAALDADDRCRIYEARPLVCRSHGVPIRLGRGADALITACELNFTARGPAAADPDCVLDQALVSTTLGAIDRTAGAGQRVELAAVLAALG